MMILFKIPQKHYQNLKYICIFKYVKERLTCWLYIQMEKPSIPTDGAVSYEKQRGLYTTEISIIHTIFPLKNKGSKGISFLI